MNVSTAVKQKYFNGVANRDETNKYLNILKNNFKEVGMVAFGQIKFLTNQEPKSEGDYNLTVIDNLVDFSKKNNLRLHYNTVINNKNSFPDWYWQLSSEKKKNFLKSHIKKVVNRYKKDFYLFKLVNECVRDKENNFLGTNESKTKLITQMFKWAKEESPASLFMINDFGNFYNKDVRQSYIELVNNIRKEDGPIDVVGLQSHMWSFQLPSNKDIENTLQLFDDEISLPLYITEFDISYDDSLHGGSKIDPQKPFTSREGIKYENWYHYQAFAYKHFFDTCKRAGFVKGFTFWELCDEDVKWERPGIGLFNEKFTPKPAYKLLKDDLSQEVIVGRSS